MLDDLKNIKGFEDKEAFSSKLNKKSKFIPSKKEYLPHYKRRDTKLEKSLESAIKASGLKSGMTISFHHHFRNGDKTVEQVLEAIKSLGIKDLTIATSSLTGAHQCLIEYIEDGTVTSLQSSGCRGKLGEFISAGHLKKPVIFRPHGGRPRAIEAGEVQIDVAFLAVSSSDEMGNSNGSHGKSVVGSLGYAKVDAKNAQKTIVITDTIVDYPNCPISISQHDVDYVVVLDEIGDSSKISSGAIRLTSNPKELVLADLAAQVVKNLPYFKDGFSMQTGSGGASLAAMDLLKKEMVDTNTKASFILGGITAHGVKLLEEGLTKVLVDTQSFDLVAAKSIAENENHIEISASAYANFHSKGCYTHNLDYTILSALEIDTNFNVNVLTGFDGNIRGAVGGHPDSAYGAKCTIITVPSRRGRIPCVVDAIDTIITPGNTIDIVVTDIGIAINPLRKDLLEILKKNTMLPIRDIKDIAKEANYGLGEIEPIKKGKKIVALVEYRDGTIIDTIKQVDDN